MSFFLNLRNHEEMYDLGAETDIIEGLLLLAILTVYLSNHHIMFNKVYSTEINDILT